MAIDTNFLRCIQEAESDLETNTADATRRVWRKAGAHLIRLHDQAESTATELHKLTAAVTQVSEGLDNMRWALAVLSAVVGVLVFAMVVFVLR